MKRNSNRTRLRRAAATVLTVSAMLALSGSGGLTASARKLSPARASVTAVAECEGDACAQVAFTFDEAKQQYRAHNNSEERWVKVSASNLAASASACLAPGKEQYLAIKTVVGSYRVDYAEVKCGETMD
jgi:hypothetical protein